LQRRHFSTLAAASLGLGLTRLADAQGGTPVAGQDYKPVATPGNPSAPAGTVDVVEFFSYACPHCFEFEPTLESWLKKKPAGIHFHRLPVHFLQNYTNFQPMYFALEAMDVVDAVQQKIFNAVHLEHQRLDKPDDIAAFMGKNGVDAKRFMSLFGSFGVRTKVQQANQPVHDVAEPGQGRGAHDAGRRVPGREAARRALSPRGARHARRCVRPSPARRPRGRGAASRPRSTSRPRASSRRARAPAAGSACRWRSSPCPASARSSCAASSAPN